MTCCKHVPDGILFACWFLPPFLPFLGVYGGRRAGSRSYTARTCPYAHCGLPRTHTALPFAQVRLPGTFLHHHLSALLPAFIACLTRTFHLQHARGPLRFVPAVNGGVMHAACISPRPPASRFTSSGCPGITGLSNICYTKQTAYGSKRAPPWRRTLVPAWTFDLFSGLYIM
jgi:hypothetical protein